MFKQLLILLMLSSYVISEFQSIKHKKQQLTELCETISQSKIIPENIASRYQNYIEKTQSNSKGTSSALPFAGMALALLFAPIIVPLFAAPGLFGAAAVSNGLASIAGGSIAAGGAGMLEGSAVLMLTGGAIGSLLSYESNPESYDDFMVTQSSIFSDSIHIGDYSILGTFHYYNRNTYLDGPAKIYNNKKLAFDGNISCDSKGCSLLGDF